MKGFLLVLFFINSVANIQAQPALVKVWDVTMSAPFNFSSNDPASDSVVKTISGSSRINLSFNVIAYTENDSSFGELNVQSATISMDTPGTQPGFPISVSGASTLHFVILKNGELILADSNQKFKAPTFIRASQTIPESNPLAVMYQGKKCNLYFSR